MAHRIVYLPNKKALQKGRVFVYHKGLKIKRA